MAGHDCDLLVVGLGPVDDVAYQVEREPHVRAILETAIAMGEVVWIHDPGAAAERDLAMPARKAAGEQDVSLAYPDLAGGCLTGSPHAGALFPQAIVDGRRLDDVLGPDAWPIARVLPGELPAGLLGVDAAGLAPVAAWLDAQGVEAVT